MELTASIARSAVFAPLADRGRAEVVTARLEEAIVLGILQPGERLPSEARLAERLGVATVTVREALADLRDRSLLTTQRGRGGGSFVTVDEAARAAAVAERIRALSAADAADLGTYFLAIVGTSARIAAEDASPSDLESLSLDLARASFGNEFSARRSLGGFHVAVVALSRSTRLVREQVRLQHADGPMLWASLQDPGEREAAAAAAQRLVDAIAAGDGDLAYREAETAVARAVRWLLAERRRLEAR